MVRLAVIQHGRDGYRLSVREMPLWALVTDRAIENVVLPATFHVFCCKHPAWTWKIGYGGHKDGDLRHSLGGLLFGTGQRLGCFGIKREHETWSVALDFDVVCEHFPGARSEWDDDGVDFVRGVMIDHVQEEHGEFGVVG
jgi:hypothetical protein